MADGLNRGRSPCAAAPRLCAGLSLFCLLSAVLCPLYAEDLADPTRPPAMIFAPETAQGPGEAAVQPSGLQTIIISETRRAAIIDGQTVELGAKHGNARLIEVNEGSVMLQGAQGLKVLTLFPDVKISKKRPLDKESHVKQPSSANKVQSGDNAAEPAAHDEKHMSGHPKEEK